MKKTMWTLLWHLSFSGGVFFFWEKWNTFTTLGFVALYGMLAFGIFFGAKIWKELETDLIKASADKVKVLVLNIFSRFRRRYNNQMYYSHRVFNVRGLRTVGMYTLDVEKVFVELRVAPAHLQQASINPMGFRELKGSILVWEFLRRMQETVALVIIGPPGCGKTTLLQHITLTLAANKQNRHGLRAYYPIFLFLREHAAYIEKDFPNLASVVQKHFSDQSRFPDLKPPPEWFKRKLEKGKCIVLLDGLDEVPNQMQREKISSWLDFQIQTYPNSLFVVSSRPMGYRDAPLNRAHVVEVMPFNSHQTIQFVHNWYRANKIISYGKDDIGVRHDAHQQALDLLTRMRKTPSINALAVNPLLLTMVTMVHNYRGALPGRRVELYQEICDVLLVHWRKAIGAQDSLTALQKRTALQPLAAYMMEYADSLEQQGISTEIAIKEISHHLKDVGLEDSHIRGFLTAIQNCSGLLLEKEAGIWSFAHLTFQEFLCALHWHETKDPRSWKLNRWVSLINESRWHETLRLYAAVGDATPIVKACLHLNTVQSLTLAADISEEALRLQHPQREEINNRLIRALESDEPHIARLAARIQLNQRLNRGFVSHDERREIDTTLVTCAEYQLFIDDMRAREQYQQPDHWTNCYFPEGHARNAISGVRFEDALAFCHWLTETTGQIYRLPHEGELESLSAHNGKLTPFWTQHNTVAILDPEVKVKIGEELKTQISFSSPQIDLHLPMSSFALVGNIKKALKKGLDSALHNYRTGGLTPILNLDSSLPPSAARVLANELALTLALTRDTTLARDLSIIAEIDLASALNLALNRNLSLNSTHDIAYTFALTLMQSLEKKINSIKLQTLIEMIKTLDFKAVLDLIKKILMTNLPDSVHRWVTLLSQVVNAAYVESLINCRIIFRHVAIQLLELTLKGLFPMVKSERQRQSWSHNQMNEFDSILDNSLRLKWFLMAIQAREDGRLSSWEGILLVREREIQNPK